MTLTKYQRGDLMEGWNDCPPIMARGLNSSSTSIDQKPSISPEAAGAQLQHIIDRLLQHPNKVPDKVSKQIKDKLSANVDKMNHLQREFVREIAQNVKDGEDIHVMKTKIIEFMMVNDGVSSWCVPLKKFVENLDQTK